MQNIPKTMQKTMKTMMKNLLGSPNTALNMVGKYSENSMYVLEVMESTNDDYILIKKCFDAIMSDDQELTLSKIYRVAKRDNNDKSEQNSDNLMLFHGTIRKNAVGILEEGFKPSSGGKHGPGVYLTESPSCAAEFSTRKYIMNLFSGLNDGLMFIFLNEILESEKLEEIVVEKEITVNTASPRKNQFEKYIEKGTAKKHSVDPYEQDSNGRKLRTDVTGEAESINYFVCHEKFVIPRYFIQCFPKPESETYPELD